MSFFYSFQLLQETNKNCEKHKNYNRDKKFENIETDLKC